MKLNYRSFLITLTVILVLTFAFLYNQKRMSSVGEAAHLKIDEIEDMKGLGYSGQRKIALGRNGDIFLTYRKKYHKKSEIFVARINQISDQWVVSGTTQPISAVGKGVDQRVPSIAVDSKNNIHIVWYGSDSQEQENNRQIKYSRSKDSGKKWSNWKNISFVDGHEKKEDYWQEHPYLLVGPGDQLFCVWEGKDKDNREQQIKFSRSSDGGDSWSQWKNIQTTPDNTQSRPTLVQGRKGELYLFMYSSSGNSQDRQQVQVSISDDSGNSWSPWQSISDPSLDSRHVSVASDSSGVVYVVWRSWNSGSPSRIIYRSFQDGKWSDTKTISTSPKNQFFPSIGVSNKGKAYISWMESENNSSLPNEDPTEGQVYLSNLTSGEFSSPRLLGTGTINLYPNLPEKFTSQTEPIIYESGAGKNLYSINLNFLK